MQKISVQLTLEELQALLSMSDNQLFRMKFVDPKFPGNKSRPDHLQVSEAAVDVLKSAMKKAKGFGVDLPLPVSARAS